MTIAHFLLFLVLLLIILQEADLRITYKDILRVRISLTIFAITFSKTHEENLSLAKSIKAIKNAPLLFLHIRHVSGKMSRIIGVSKVLQTLTEHGRTVNVEEPVGSGNLVKGTKGGNAASIGCLPVKEGGKHENTMPNLIRWWILPGAIWLNTKAIFRWGWYWSKPRAKISTGRRFTG